MPKDTVWMQEMSSADIADYLRRDEAVIVPIGSCETHGPHLPTGTDTYEAISYSEGIARKAGVLCTAPIWFGDSPHHLHKPGTVSLQPETVIAVLKDVYRSLIHHGFRQIITFNGHRWANLHVINIASRAIKAEHPGVLFACMDPVALAAERTQEVREEPGAGSHGDELETSAMLYAYPDLVHADRYVFSHGMLIESRFVPTDPFASGDKVMYIGGVEDQARLAPVGHVGDPRKASAAKGQALFEAIVANGAEFIADLRRHARNGARAQGGTGSQAEELFEKENQVRRRRRDQQWQ